MRLLLIFFCLMCHLTIFGQYSVEAYGGLSLNSFHDYQKDQGHYQSSYGLNEIDYSFGIGVDKFVNDWRSFFFTLQYDKYSGNFMASDGGLGGGYSTIGKINKSMIGLGLFPLSYRIFNCVNVNFGAELSMLVHEEFEGVASGWSINTVPYSPSNSWSYNLQDKFDQFSNSRSLGLKFRISYNFKIKEQWFISPQYGFYFGLLNEFIKFPDSTKSMRHYFSIGIKKFK